MRRARVGARNGGTSRGGTHGGCTQGCIVYILILPDINDRTQVSYRLEASPGKTTQPYQLSIGRTMGRTSQINITICRS